MTNKTSSPHHTQFSPEILSLTYMNLFWSSEAFIEAFNKHIILRNTKSHTTSSNLFWTKKAFIETLEKGENRISRGQTFFDNWMVQKFLAPIVELRKFLTCE